MTAAVDLVAVRRAREALRALTAAHPELTAAATRHRAAAWMHDQEHNEMSRKLNDEQTSTAEQIGVRLPPDLLARLDAEAARLSALTATPFTRSMVVRSVLARALPMLDGTTRPTTAQEPAQEPAQGTTTSSTPARPPRARKAPARPAAPAREADDEADDDHQLPLLDAANDHDRRNAAQAALLDAHDDGHDRRSAEHTAAALLRAEIIALNMSGRAIGDAMTAAGWSVTGRSVAQFVNGHTAGLPRWADDFRAWRASVAAQEAQGGRA